MEKLEFQRRVGRRSDLLSPPMWGVEDVRLESDGDEISVANEDPHGSKCDWQYCTIPLNSQTIAWLEAAIAEAKAGKVELCQCKLCEKERATKAAQADWSLG
ncbi:MAG: hypothetical protein EOM24_04190 [Chloroflexia bacterium]|nr:hypothetical protein [Chloroflexia bacterium]